MASIFYHLYNHLIWRSVHAWVEIGLVAVMTVINLASKILIDFMIILISLA